MTYLKIFCGVNEEAYFAEDQKEGWKVTLSIGITDIKKNSKLNDLIEEADRAMYFSKCSGKNKITYYEDIK
ncbi:MAG TPA: diguanylate cyclase [Fusobacterium ulcerans]|nr:diguanylate cyclase [Fusobacterium ulcerans]